MSNPVQEFKNENIIVHLEQGPLCLLKLKITVLPTATSAAYTKAVKAVSKEVVIPGFRKGKVPESMLLQQYGKQIDREFQDILLSTAFRESLALTKKYPFDEKSSVKRAKVTNHSPKDGATLEIDYECYPDVPDVDFHSLKLKKIDPKPVEEKDIDRTVQNLVYSLATWQEVTEKRPVQEGDFVDVDLLSLQDGKETWLFQDRRCHIAEGKIEDWIRDLVIGLKVGEQAEGMSRYPQADASAQALVTIPCRVIVKKIQTAELPPVDDAFAVKMGVPTLPELRERIKKALEKEALEHVQESMRQVMSQELLSHYRFDLPGTLFNQEMKEAVANKVRERIPPSVSAEQKEKEIEALKAETADETDRALRLRLLLYKVARGQKIEVSWDEVVKELISNEKLMRFESTLKDDEAKRQLFQQINHFLTLRKTMDYLISQVKG